MGKEALVKQIDQIEIKMRQLQRSIGHYERRGGVDTLDVAVLRLDLDDLVCFHGRLQVQLARLESTNRSQLLLDGAKVLKYSPTSPKCQENEKRVSRPYCRFMSWPVLFCCHALTPNEDPEELALSASF